MTLHALPSARHIVRTAAQVLVDQLVLQQVDHVFCIPGKLLFKSFLDEGFGEKFSN